MLSCRMWSVPHANDWWETSNAARSWHRQLYSSWRGSRQWTAIDLVRCHPPWPGSCQSWFVLATDFTSRCQRERGRERETEQSLWIIKMHSVILCIVNMWGFSNCMRGFIFHKSSFSVYLRPLLLLVCPPACLHVNECVCFCRPASPPLLFIAFVMIDVQMETFLSCLWLILSLCSQVCVTASPTRQVSTAPCLVWTLPL